MNTSSDDKLIGWWILNQGTNLKTNTAHIYIMIQTWWTTCYASCHFCDGLFHDTPSMMLTTISPPSTYDVRTKGEQNNQMSLQNYQVLLMNYIFIKWKDIKWDNVLKPREESTNHHNKHQYSDSYNPFLPWLHKDFIFVSLY